MPDQVRIFTPEIEELLAAAARAPGSMLLRAPRNAELRGGFELHAGVSARAAGLSSPERKLLEVYREETAEALRKWVALALVRGDHGACHVEVMDAGGGTPREPDPEELRGRAEKLVSSPFVRQTHASVVDQLRELQRDPVSLCANPRDVALLSLRFRPSDATRITLAVVHELEGSLGPSRRVLQSVLDHSPGRVLRALALYDWGLVSRMEGRLDNAVDAYEAAFELSPAWVVPLSAMLFTLVEQENTKRAIEAASRLDELTDGTDSALTVMAEDLRRESVRIGHVPSRKMVEVVKEVRIQGGAATRRFFDVFGKMP